MRPAANLPGWTNILFPWVAGIEMSAGTVVGLHDSAGQWGWDAGDPDVSPWETQMAGANAIGQVVTTAASVGAPVAGGLDSLGAKAAAGVGTEVATAEVGSEAGRGPVIIGETMARVEAAADRVPGAKILNDMPDFRAAGMKPHEVTSAMMRYNRRWILEQMRSGRPIMDIGPDPNRSVPSIFYQMERSMLRNYQRLHPEFPGAVGP